LDAQKRYKGKPVEVYLSPPGDLSIFSKNVDIFAPSALGGILNENTIPLITAPIVCGAANNQLLYTQDGERLRKRDISYVPDFVANRMGIVNCANEQYGYVVNDPNFNDHFGTHWDNAIYNIVSKTLELASQKAISPDLAACEIADELAKKPHPIWGHRTKLIINSLIQDRWETGQ